MMMMILLLLSLFTMSNERFTCKYYKISLVNITKFLKGLKCESNKNSIVCDLKIIKI